MVASTSELKEKKTILTNYQKIKCNAINYNVIFIGEILYKEVFILYCYVNLCYCIVRAAFNLSICRMDR